MEIYKKALEWIEQGRSFAFGIVVQAQGSTPQKAGSKAILDDQGHQIGTLGGGLVESDGLNRMSQAINDNIATLYEFTMSEDYSRDAGPICGGIMRLFVNPNTEINAAPLREALKAIENRQRGILLTTLAGDTESQGAVTWISCENGHATASAVSQDDIDSSLREERPLLSQTESGGEVFIEPVIPRPALLIVGAGHVGRAVAEQGVQLGFEVTVYDDRAELAHPDLFPEGVHTAHGDLRELVTAFPIDKSTYIVLVSKGHKPDAEALEACIHSKPAYLGMIGSGRKIRFLHKHFLEEGLATEEEFDRVVAPIGYEIGAVTVPEIAISIAAQLIAARRRPAAVSDVAPKSPS